MSVFVSVYWLSNTTRFWCPGSYGLGGSKQGVDPGYPLLPQGSDNRWPAAGARGGYKRRWPQSASHAHLCCANSRGDRWVAAMNAKCSSSKELWMPWMNMDRLLESITQKQLLLWESTCSYRLKILHSRWPGEGRWPYVVYKCSVSSFKWIPRIHFSSWWPHNHVPLTDTQGQLIRGWAHFLIKVQISTNKQEHLVEKCGRVTRTAAQLRRCETQA